MKIRKCSLTQQRNGFVNKLLPWNLEWDPENHSQDVLIWNTSHLIHKLGRFKWSSWQLLEIIDRMRWETPGGLRRPLHFCDLYFQEPHQVLKMKIWKICPFWVFRGKGRVMLVKYAQTFSIPKSSSSREKTWPEPYPGIMGKDIPLTPDPFLFYAERGYFSKGCKREKHLWRSQVKVESSLSEWDLNGKL